MIPTLKVLKGKGMKGKTFPLEKGEVTIGRFEDCDVRLDVDGISRLHCELKAGRGNTWTISDLQSTNGTLVNEEEVQTTRLVPGDKIRVGPILLEFVFRLPKEEQTYLNETTDHLVSLLLDGEGSVEERIETTIQELFDRLDWRLDDSQKAEVFEGLASLCDDYAKGQGWQHRPAPTHVKRREKS